MALRTRPPTGQMAAPRILIEGETGAGKSWITAQFSASPKVNRTLWLEIGETTADEYGRIPVPGRGHPRYEIVEHDGSWVSIYQAVIDAKEASANDRLTDPRPNVLVLDTVGAVWDMLFEWTDNRARSSKKNRELLLADPNAEIDITANYWNDANKRWRQLMTQVLLFPGLVILLARGRETVHIGPGGTPDSKLVDYKVEGQKSLTSDVQVWLRMTNDMGPDKAKIMKLRSVHQRIEAPKKGVPRQLARAHGEIISSDLEALVFDRLGYDPANATHQVLVPLRAGNDAPLSEYAGTLEQAMHEAVDEAGLRAAWQAVLAAHSEQKITDDDRRQLTGIANRLKLQMAHEAEKARLLARLPQNNPPSGGEGSRPPGEVHSDDPEHAQIRRSPFAGGEGSIGHHENETEGEHQAARYADVHSIPYPQGEQAQADLGV